SSFVVLWQLYALASGFRKVAAALTHDHRRIAGQIYHGGGLKSTEAAVDDKLQLMLQSLPNVVGIRQGVLIARQYQAAAHQGLAQFLQQRQSDPVVRNTQANSLPLWMLEPPRRFGSRLEDKGERSGGV